jgi:hypothetical protein
MKYAKTTIGTFLLAALVVAGPAAASTVYNIPDQPNIRDDSNDNHQDANNDNEYSHPDFPPSEEGKEYNDDKQGDYAGGHDGFNRWREGRKDRRDGFDGWHDGKHGGFDGWHEAHEGHEGWHHGDWEHNCHDKPVPPVPVPAAVWLFGSGMLLLGRIATRRRA